MKILKKMNTLKLWTSLKKVRFMGKKIQQRINNKKHEFFYHFHSFFFSLERIILSRTFFKNHSFQNDTWRMVQEYHRSFSFQMVAAGSVPNPLITRSLGAFLLKIEQNLFLPTILKSEVDQADKQSTLIITLGRTFIQTNSTCRPCRVTEGDKRDLQMCQLIENFAEQYLS